MSLTSGRPAKTRGSFVDSHRQLNFLAFKRGSADSGAQLQSLSYTAESELYSRAAVQRWTCQRCSRLIILQRTEKCDSLRRRAIKLTRPGDTYTLLRWE